MKDSLLNNIEINTIKDCEDKFCICNLEDSIKDKLKYEEDLHNVELDGTTFDEIYKNVFEKVVNDFVCISDTEDGNEDLRIFVNKQKYKENLFVSASEIASDYDKLSLNDLEERISNGFDEKIKDLCEDTFLYMCNNELPGYEETKYQLRSKAYKEFLINSSKQAVEFIKQFVLNRK